MSLSSHNIHHFASNNYVLKKKKKAIWRVTKSTTDTWLHEHLSCTSSWGLCAPQEVTLGGSYLLTALSSHRKRAKWKPHLGYRSEHKVQFAGQCLGQMWTRAGRPLSHWDPRQQFRVFMKWESRAEAKRVHLLSRIFRSLCNPFTRHTNATWLPSPPHSKNTNPSPELVGRDLRRGGVREISAASHLSATYDISLLPWFLH